MADVETYGGSCPNCSKPLLQKFDTGHGSWLTFDACPHCGFAHGESNREDMTPDEVWRSVLNHWDAVDLSDLRAKVEPMGIDEDAMQPSVFQYTALSADAIRAKCWPS